MGSSPARLTHMLVMQSLPSIENRLSGPHCAPQLLELAVAQRQAHKIRPMGCQIT
jgi:hypothetical protein